MRRIRRRFHNVTCTLATACARHRRRAILPLAGAVVLLAGGCLITSANHVEEEGVRVSEATLSQVVPGATTEAWLIAALGEPTARSADAGVPGREILRYDFRRVDSSTGTMLFLFAGSTRREESGRAFFEVTNGVVTRAWRES